MPAITSQLPTDQYWASVPREKLPEIVRTRADMYWQELERRGYTALWRRVFQTYYGVDANGDWATSCAVVFSGEDGERVMPRMGQFRSICDGVLSLGGHERPAFIAKAVNDRAKALMEAPIATGIIQSIWDDWSLEERGAEVDKLALLYGVGFHHLRWSIFDGPIDKQSPTVPGALPRREGDVIAESCPPWRVVHEIHRTERMEWAIVAHEENVWTLAARYPQMAEQILAQRGGQHRWCDNVFGTPFVEWEGMDMDQVTVWCVYHRPTDAIPRGRYSIVCGELCLYDGPSFLDDEVPVRPQVPARVVGVGSGYSGVWDLLVPQELYDAGWSNLETNHDASGTKVMFVAKGSNINEADLAAGKRVIECDVGPDGELVKPETVDLLGSQSELYKHMDAVEAFMEKSSGLNSVARGEPNANLKSGAALALVQSLAVQFNSAFQAARIITREKLAKLGYTIVRKTMPKGSTRLAQLAGSGDDEYLKKVSVDDMEDVRSVQIEVGSPLMNQPAGRLEIAQTLLQTPGMIDTPQQLLQLIDTGRLDPMLKAPVAALNIIATENDLLNEKRLPTGEDKTDPKTGQVMVGPDGMPVKSSVRATQDHATHVREHAALLTTFADPQVIAIVEQHIKDHVEMLSQMPAFIAELTGQTVMPPPPPPMPGEMPPEDGAPPPEKPKGGPKLPKGNAPAPGRAQPLGAPPPPGGPMMPVNPLTNERAPVGPGAPPTPV